MNKKILVKVEQKHINLGLRGNCSSCPIALAIKEINQSKFVSIGYKDASIYFLERDDTYTFDLPRAARRFINRFDKDVYVKAKPFNFYLKPQG